MARKERISRKCGLPLVSSIAGRLTIQSFLERIFHYTHIAPSVYVVAYIYIDRLCQLHPHFRISSNNVHRLLITAIMVASKFMEDLWVSFPLLFFSYPGRFTWCSVTLDHILHFWDLILYLFSFRNYRNSYFAKVGGLMMTDTSDLEFDFFFLDGFYHLERQVSVGGGYYIERTLRIMCREKEKRDPDHRLTRIVGCSSH